MYCSCFSALLLWLILEQASYFLMPTAFLKKTYFFPNSLSLSHPPSVLQFVLSHLQHSFRIAMSCVVDLDISCAVLPPRLEINLTIDNFEPEKYGADSYTLSFKQAFFLSRFWREGVFCLMFLRHSFYNIHIR